MTGIPKQIISIGFTLLLFCGCGKQSNSPTNVLPPVTSQGLNTFGCKVNGKIFVPQKPSGDTGPYYACTYEALYADPVRPYAFAVWGKDKQAPCSFSNISIGLDSVDLQQGVTYRLSSWLDSSGRAAPGKKHAIYSLTGSCSQLINYYTTDFVTGEITITYLNPLALIVSGTFWFDAVSRTSDTVHITEGRFDMHFTQ